MSLQEVKKEEYDFIRGVGGYINLTEFNQNINDIQRKKIKAFKEQNGECYLGKINYYGEQRENIDNEEILIEYEGQKIYNFEFTFCVPVYDEKLIELIKEYNKMESSSQIMNHIESINNRINELKGEHLIWV